MVQQLTVKNLSDFMMIPAMIATGIQVGGRAGFLADCWDNNDNNDNNNTDNPKGNCD
jgi:hypothetical protein